MQQFLTPTQFDTLRDDMSIRDGALHKAYLTDAEAAWLAGVTVQKYRRDIKPLLVTRAVTRKLSYTPRGEVERWIKGK